MADKNLDGNGLSEVWVRAAQLVKKYTGAVDSTKGDLQTQVNEKLSGTDDTKDNTVTFTSADESNPTAWKDVNVLSSKEKHSLILNKISNMFSNIRYLYKNVGGIKGLSSSSAITTQGEYALDAREKNASVDGTLANQISNLNSNFDTKADKAQLSNPNLLDNPFFNVNSRNLYGSIQEYKYFADRWRAWRGVTYNTDNSITLSAGESVSIAEQYLNFDINEPIKMTASIMYTDGSIQCISGILGLNNGISKGFSNKLYCYVEYDTTKNYYRFRLWYRGDTNVDIMAVKLEIGEISTLHMDVAPNVEEERIRCMLSTTDANDTYANKGALTQDLWNSTKTYSVGAYCIWNGIMWKCLVENSGVTPVEGDTWTATSISAELASIISKIDALSA